MKLKELRELVNSHLLSDDDIEVEIYDTAGEIITDPVDFHEDESVDGNEKILIFG